MPSPIGSTGPSPEAPDPYKVVAYDFGMKRNILRMLAAAGCDVTVVPAATTAEEALALDPDGVFLSNGPGDPEPVTYAIEAARRSWRSGRSSASASATRSSASPAEGRPSSSSSATGARTIR